MSKLTAKQSAFVQEYLIDLNATQAAIRAGYSKKTARQTGTENLSKPVIMAAIQKAKQERSERTKITAEGVLTRLQDEWDADISQLYAADGTFKAVSEWPEPFRKGLVQSIEHDDKGNISKIRLVNRDKTKELVGKHVDVQAFKESIVVTKKQVIMRDFTGE